MVGATAETIVQKLARPRLIVPYYKPGFPCYADTVGA
jgi:hypothetical protein